MKNTRSFILMIALLLSSVQIAQVYAQTTRGINYQAVARDGDGTLLTSTPMDLQFSLYDDSEALVWQEKHSVTTDEFGRLQVVILDGMAEKTGGFAASPGEIDWGAGTLSLNVLIEYNGITSDLGTETIRAVPYALYAMNGSGD